MKQNEKKPEEKGTETKALTKEPSENEALGKGTLEKGASEKELSEKGASEKEVSDKAPLEKAEEPGLEALQRELAGCREDIRLLTEALAEAERQAAREKGRADGLEAALHQLPRIVTGGGEPLPETVAYTREEIAGMSAAEINSHWQGIKNSVKRLF